MMAICKATPQDVEELGARMCEADKAEMLAAGHDDLRAVLEGVTAYAARWDGELLALFGCEAHPDDASIGIPWLLCTTTLQRVPAKAMAGMSRAVVSRWMDGRWNVMANAVHGANSRAVAFVNWLGFKVLDQPVGPGGQFRVFRWEARRV